MNSENQDTFFSIVSEYDNYMYNCKALSIIIFSCARTF